MIGQAYFLKQDWHWPLFVADRLVSPAGTNIAMTDSIPLEALLLKSVHIFFPGVQQGITLFLAVCWFLQPVCAVFALRAMGEKNLLPAISISLLSACFPTFLARINHSALCAHWILLLALGLYFKALELQNRGRFWPLWLLAVLTDLTLLIHPYLMVMVGALLGAVSLSTFFRKEHWKISWVSMVAILLSGSCLLLTGKIFGYWGGASGGGYGVYSMNLASPLWPAHSSLFLHATQEQIDATGGQYEGYQYLGAGVLFLIIILACQRRTWTLLRDSLLRNIGLLLACISLTGIAVSNKMYFFHTLIVQTHFMVPGAEQMRSSGRMFWPVAYIILLGAVGNTYKIWPRAAPTLLGIAVILQWVDTRNLRFQDRATEASLFRPSVEKDNRLFEIMQKFDHIEIYPRLECDATGLKENMPIIYASAYQNASINTMYTARSLPEGGCHLAQERPHTLDNNTLVIFNGTHRVTKALSWTNRTQVNCGALNTFVLCTGIQHSLKLAPISLPIPLPLNQIISMSSSNPLHSEVLESGWAGSEKWGTWNEGNQAFLFFIMPKNIKKITVTLSLRSAPGTPKHVKIFSNDKYLDNWSISQQEKYYSLNFIVPKNNNVHLRMEIDRVTKIKEDPRALGIGISSIKLSYP
ncbi:DUF6311 domain-containing protein [Gluconobacter oxydans]|uniref:DUF6311 domain-containing protein n=1 Tax=Gluconobacter TaxID=441 RepID=UPI00062C5310|nr:DUF6311 domain-containing protein [Gluconobacter oxydans]